VFFCKIDSAVREVALENRGRWHTIGWLE
jgi:hypothetical protein